MNVQAKCPTSLHSIRSKYIFKFVYKNKVVTYQENVRKVLITFNHPDLLSGGEDEGVEILFTDFTSNPLSSLLSLTLTASLSDRLSVT